LKRNLKLSTMNPAKVNLATMNPAKVNLATMNPAKVNLASINLSNFDLYKLASDRKIKEVTFAVFGFVAGFVIATISTSSSKIGIAFGLICCFLPTIVFRIKEENSRRELEGLWPEILDHIISGITSGLALAETLADLKNHGPIKTRPIFASFQNSLINGGTFEDSLELLKVQFANNTCDQVCEVLRFAKSSGGRDMNITLRTLNEYVRSDLALRNEISAKHGWVKNSAALAAIAPWILLLILASQPNTVSAYSTGSGVSILLLGVLLTVIAYLWMERVGRIRKAPRIFALKKAGSFPIFSPRFGSGIEA
jgi:tight adherence protein B